MQRCVNAFLLIFVLLSVLLPSTVAAAATPAFPVGPSVTLPLNTLLLPLTYSPTFLSGDFNGDGLPDAVVLIGYAENASGILVLLNTKGGSPVQVTTPLSNCNSPSMATADVNQDQKLDLVLYCGGSYLLAFLGNGDGTFQAPVVEQTPTTPRIFSLADFNNDGLPDLAYLTTTGFSIALNTGGGHFGPAQSYPLTGAANFETIASGDFNGDGKQDLVFAIGSGSVSGPAAYVSGNGDGTFGAPATISGTVQQIAVGDFNGDGYSDLAYFTPANKTPANPSVVVLPGGSSGLADTGVAISAIGAIPSFLTAVSLTGKGGNLDLVLGNNTETLSVPTQSNTLIFLGNGKGDFQSPVSYAANSVYGVVDLNGDGIPDLAGLEQPYDDGLPYAPGNGDGTFQALPSTPNGQSAQGLTVADMNGDGLADAILFGQTGAPQVFLARGDGRFTPVPNSSLSPVAPGLIVAADFNGDGNIDIAVILPGSFSPGNNQPVTNAAVAVYLGNGDGTLTFRRETQLNIAVVTAAVSGDFNGDKKQDLALLYSGQGGYTTASVFLPGNGDGTFGTAKQIPLATNTTSTGVLQAVDLNGDGITDLIALGASYLGSAAGTFSTALQILPGDGWAADLNGDGKYELLGFASGITAGNGSLNVYSGNGDGTFSSTPQTSPASVIGGYYATAVGDVNGDGLPDIAVNVQSAGENDVTIFLNQGGGSFTQDQTQYFAGIGRLQEPGYSGGPTAIALARLNATSVATGTQHTFDGLVYTSGGLTALLNQSNPEPQPLPDISVSFAGGVSSITTGASVTVNAALFVTGATPPTGTVTFFAGNTQRGTSAVTGGAASVTAPVTGNGAVVIRAVYSGDNTYGSVTGFASLTVNAPVASTATLTASATTADEKQQLTLTATVQGDSPTGTVTFFSGTTSLGTGTLSGGSATLATSFANAGTVSVTASYAGDANNLSSVSSPVTITVVAPSFAVGASPASAIVTAGQSATFTIAVTPAGGFASAVNLSCGALPSESNCVFSSQSVTPVNGQPAQLKLTISTAASSADLRRSMNHLPGRDPWLPGGAIVSLAGLIGFLRNRAAGRRYHYWLRTMSVWIVACGVGMSLIGCGGSGGGNSTPTNPGTSAGTSNITVSASVSGGNSTQTANIQLTIQ
jgi:Bacterial Ig-like domain (group 3)/FG-GAP-like repeat/FG-GAP repeat